MDEQVLQNGSDLQLSSSSFQGNLNYEPNVAQNTLFHQNMFKSEDNESYSVSEWLGYHQMAPYVEYLTGNGISNIQGELPYDNTTGIGCNFTPNDSFHSMDAHQVTHSRCQQEELLANNFVNSQNENCYPVTQKSPKTYLRQKATDSDRRRRTRIATALDALEDLLPESKEGNKSNIVDDSIDYIKYLQNQMKELSQNRLLTEPTSNQLTYLEGYGYYLVDENMATGPLQDMLANLMETDPCEATKLLEKNGLFMMPNISS